MSRLPPNWPALRLWLLGSCVAGTTSVVDVVDQAARAHAGREEAARAAAARRSEDYQRRIVAAAGALPLSHPQTPQAVHRRITKAPNIHGFAKAPDLRTIRRALQKVGMTEPLCTPQAPSAPHTTARTT